MSSSENGSDGPLSGEAELPHEHTIRVRHRKNPESKLSVHDGEPEQPEARSSTELAGASRKARRRERDQRAERRAMQVLVFLFVGLGGLAFIAVGFIPDDPPTPAQPAVDGGLAVAPPPPPKRPGIVSTFEETADLPALKSLSDEGLTVAAEGLPEVTAASDATGLESQAALQTCRFAYGVWEFSPNKRFRFLTTCGALDGQILVGAYQVQGTKVRMSPLTVGSVTITTEFEVQKPSKMKSQLTLRDGTVLMVSQRVTAIHPGMEGEGFRNTFAPKNTLLPQGLRNVPSPTAPSAPPPPSKKAKDPLLDLLRQKK